MKEINLQKKYDSNIISIIILLIITMYHISCDTETKNDIESTSSEIKLEYNKLDLSNKSLSKTISISSNTEWELLNNSTWVSAYPNEGKAGTNIPITLEITENDTFYTRLTKIIIKSKNPNSSSDTLTIKQSGVSSYVDIDWNKIQISSFNTETGDLVLICESTPPQFRDSISTIILLTDSIGYIRRVNSSQYNGKTIELKTETGYMSDIFIDQEFTLSTSPLTKTIQTHTNKITTTDHQGVIHPIKITQTMTDGSIETIYDISSNEQTKNIPPINGNRQFYNKETIKTNEKIYECKFAKLLWDKFEFKPELDGEFYFKFEAGSRIINKSQKVPSGELSNFYCFLTGKITTDLILAAKIKKQYEDNVNDIPVLSNIVNSTFIFPVGGIMLPITIQADLLANAKLKSEGEAKLSAGFCSNMNTQIGLNYINESISPINKSSATFNIYKPELDLKANINVEAAFYPKINILFFNFAGPSIAIKPHIGDNFEIGSQIGGNQGNYVGWNNDIYFRPKAELALNLRFVNKHVSTKPLSINMLPSEKIEIIKSPHIIEIVSPKDIDIMEYDKDQSIPITFKVKDYTIIKNDDFDFSTVGAVVKLEKTSGILDKEFALTDYKGELSINWIPLKKNATLTAKIIGADGNSISQVTFSPKISESEFSIVGKWKAPDVWQEKPYMSWKHIYTFTNDGNYLVEVNPDSIWYKYELDTWIHETLHTSTEKGRYQIDTLSNILRTECISANTYNFTKTYMLRSDGNIINYNEHESVIPQEEKIGKDVIGGSITIISNDKIEIKGYNIYTNKPCIVSYERIN